MPKSIWQAAAQPVSFDALERSIKADVAIVGAGITGVLCAHALVDRGLRVAVLEAGRVGESSTGNSTGNLYALVGERHGALDRKAAAQLCAARGQAVDLIENLVEGHEIDCGFVRCPWVMHASQAGHPALADARELAAAAGLPTRRATDLLPFPVADSVVVDGQAQFDPLRFTKGLAARLASDECRIYEATRVTDIDVEDRRLTTRLGDVHAEWIILATHTPKGRLLLHAELTPNREYGVAGQVKSGVLRPGIFWSADAPFHSVRLYEWQQRSYLVVVGAEHRTGAEDDTDRCYAELAQFARERFGVTPIEYRWSAQNYRSADGLPFIGRSAQSDHVLVATGFAADGLTYAGVAAPLLADVITRRDNALADRLDPQRRPALAAAKTIGAEAAHMIAGLAHDLPGLDRGDMPSLARGEGRILDRGTQKLAVHRDDAGSLHVVSAVCTHMQCIVHWNTAERTWDCPCHGSRFTPDGKVLEGPALADLAQRDLD
ncbi:MAG TPA: FAD-dependent oxidoreductase [Casimicrobiaceae bacterium]|nr:FAD-dependent oxidoreductase [Casimicrobiaceae bacterium]